MNQFGKNPSESTAEAYAKGRPGSAVRVHVTKVTDTDGDRQARDDGIEVIETTVAEIATVLKQRGIGPDEPVTIIIEPVEDTRTIRLSADDQRVFAEGILNPPEPTPALQRRRPLLRDHAEFRLNAEHQTRGAASRALRDI
jgi:hypothetical protein